MEDVSGGSGNNQDSAPGFVWDDKVVSWLAYCLGIAQAALNRILYRRLAGYFERRHGGRPWLYSNYAYVFGFWMPVLLAAYLMTDWFRGGWWLLIAIVPCWRWFEVLVWWVKLLLDRAHTNILAAERNLVFLAADAIAVVTASLVVWRTAESVKGGVSWANALSTFTLNGPPPGLSGRLGEVVAILSAASGVVLAGAALGLLIGIVGERVKEVPGVYTGPRIPPRP